MDVRINICAPKSGTANLTGERKLPHPEQIIHLEELEIDGTYSTLANKKVARTFLTDTLMYFRHLKRRHGAHENGDQQER